MGINVGNEPVAARYGMAVKAGQAEQQQYEDRLQLQYDQMQLNARLVREGRAAQIYSQMLGQEHDFQRMAFGAQLGDAADERQLGRRTQAQDWLAGQQQGRQKELEGLEFERRKELLEQGADLQAKADERRHELELETQRRTFDQQDKNARLQAELEHSGRVKWAQFAMDFEDEQRARKLDKQGAALEQAFQSGEINDEEYADLSARHRREVLEHATGLDPAPTLKDDWEREHIPVEIGGRQVPLVRGKDGEWQVPRGVQLDNPAETMQARHFEIQLKSYYDRQEAQAKIAYQLYQQGQQAALNAAPGTTANTPSYEESLIQARQMLPDLAMPTFPGAPGAAAPAGGTLPPSTGSAPGTPAAAGQLPAGQPAAHLGGAMQSMNDLVGQLEDPQQQAQGLEQLSGLVQQYGRQMPSLAQDLTHVQQGLAALTASGQADFPAGDPQGQQAEQSLARLVNLHMSARNPFPLPSAAEDAVPGIIYGPLTGPGGRRVAALWDGRQFHTVALYQRP